MNLSIALSAVDTEVPSLSFSSKDPPMTVGCDNSVGSDISVSSEVSVSYKSEPTALSDSAQSSSPPQISLPPASSQDSPNLLQCLDVTYESMDLLTLALLLLLLLLLLQYWTPGEKLKLYFAIDERLSS